MIRRNKKRLPDPGRAIRKRDYLSGKGRGSLSPSLDASRAGRGNPAIQGAPSATRGRFLLSGRFMAAGSGTPYGVPVPLFRFSTPAVSPPPIAVESDLADSTSNKESNP